MAELESFFSDLKPAGTATPKQGQKPLVDYFKDVGVPDTGPVNPNQIVKPRNVDDIFTPEEGVDYDTGIPLHQRLNLYRASSNKGPSGKSEQEIYLENTYGKNNFRKDPSGAWLVKGNWPTAKPDQWVAAFPRGIAGTLENAGIGLAAPALTTGGGMLGAAAGGVVGGIPGSVAGMAIGSGSGRLVDEGMKALQGFYDKTPGELARDTGVEAGINALFQGAPPAWNASKGWIYNTTAENLRRFTGVTPETRDLTRQLMQRYGVTPPIESIAPRAKAFAYDRVQRNRTSGDPRAEARRDVMNQRINEILSNSGLSPADQQLATDYIYNTSVAPTAGRTGELVRDAMVARNERSQAVQDAFIEDAHRALDRAVDTYKRNIMGPVYATPKGAKQSEVSQAGNLARGITKTMEDARGDFGREMNVVYDNFHDAAGGAPVIDGTDIVERLQDLVHSQPTPVRNVLSKAEGRTLSPDDIPDSVAPNVAKDDIKSIMDAIAHRLQNPPPAEAGVGAAANDNPTMLTIKEAHNLRSSLMEMVRLRGDTASIGYRRGEVYQIVHAIDAAMDKVALEAGGTVGSAMREANQQWAEGVVRFTNEDINQIMRQTKAGRPPDPGVVADAIMNKDSLTAVKQIIDMLPPDQRFAVQQADLQNIIKSASIPVGKFGRPTIDPDALIQAITERASANRVLYGRNDPTLKALEDLAVAFKALNGQVELDSLPGFAGNVVPFGRSPTGMQRGVIDVISSLKSAAAEQRRIQAEVANDVQAALRSNDPKLVDGGVRYILGSEARTIRAAEILGPTSPEWQLLQREAKVELLRNAVTPLLSGVGSTINAEALRGAMRGLTARQQQMLLPGADLADFQLLAQQAKMLFPELAQDPGGSLAAAQTLGNLPKANAIRRWTWSQVAGFIADSKTVAHLLAGTLRSDPYEGRKLLSYLMQYGVNTGMAKLNQSGGQAEESGAPSFDEQMRALESVHKPVPKGGYKGPSD